jgi:ribosomal subunit interface protein
MTGPEGSSSVDIIFKARHTGVLEKFRKHAIAKLSKIEKLDSRAIRVDVEISAERNPRLADRRERVELTVSTRGPAIRAEAAAEDRFAALDIAFAKLESRLRRACDRRKSRHGAHAAVRLTDLPEADLASDAELPAIRLGAGGGLLAGNGAAAIAAMAAASDAADAADSAAADSDPENLVPIEVQGDGPLVVREKFHVAVPMTIDQALFEMELVGHDFFLFTDAANSMPSVVYRRRGYQYGVIRLVEEYAPQESGGPQLASSQPDDASRQLSHASAQRGQANGQVGLQTGRRATRQPNGRAGGKRTGQGRPGRQQTDVAGA